MVGAVDDVTKVVWVVANGTDIAVVKVVELESTSVTRGGAVGLGPLGIVKSSAGEG